MNRLHNNRGVYPPEILRTMGTAFDAAWDVLRENCKNRQSSRQELARIIFGFVDEGEIDALDICKLALDETGRPDVRLASKVSPSDLAVWNGLRSLPGRNWHVLRPQKFSSWTGNLRPVDHGSV